MGNGYGQDQNILDQVGITVPPPLSLAGTGRIYFDATDNTFKVSQNGGAFANLATGTGIVSATLPLVNTAGVLSVGGVIAPTTPDATADSVFGSSAAAKTPVVVQGAAAQSAPLQEWQNSAGSALASVDSEGILSGYLVKGVSKAVAGAAAGPSNSSALTSLLSAALAGSFTLPAGILNVIGRTLKIKICGSYQFKAAPIGNVTLDVYLEKAGPAYVTLLSINGGLAAALAGTSGGFQIETTGVIVSIGAVGSLALFSQLIFSPTGGGQPVNYAVTAVSAIDTTVAQEVKAEMTFATADVANILRGSTPTTVEVLG